MERLEPAGGEKAAALPERVAVRAESVAAVRKHLDDQEAAAKIDHMHATFDAVAAERAELEREWNVMREMALEQQKHDDEILKKYIALI